MSQDELSGPDLDGVVANANAVGLEHVVIGGFAVIYHGHVRATKDSDLLVPDGPEADAAVLRVNSRHGIIDIMSGEIPPLDYDTVAERAEAIEFRGQPTRIASLRSLVGFKRLAHRADPDRSDLRNLEALHGPLPTDPIPGLDT
jgi:hypothetical protein